jgi:integration host factor subunit beta
MADKKYTKADIVDSVYQKIGMSRKEIRAIIDVFLEDIKEALIKQMVIELRGFGTFEIKVRKGRQRARNPRTGELVTVTSHGIAFFRPGRELKQDVWNLDGGKEGAFDPGETPPDETGEKASGAPALSGGIT